MTFVNKMLINMCISYIRCYTSSPYFLHFVMLNTFLCHEEKNFHEILVVYLDFPRMVCQNPKKKLGKIYKKLPPKQIPLTTYCRAHHPTNPPTQLNPTFLGARIADLKGHGLQTSTGRCTRGKNTWQNMEDFRR